MDIRLQDQMEQRIYQTENRQLRLQVMMLILELLTAVKQKVVLSRVEMEHQVVIHPQEVHQKLEMEHRLLTMVLEMES